MTPPVGVARRRRAPAAAVAAAAPLSPPHAPPATATWLYVPPCALAAMEQAGVPCVDAQSSYSRQDYVFIDSPLCWWAVCGPSLGVQSFSNAVHFLWRSYD